METLFAFDMVLLSLEQVIIRKPGMIKGGFEDERGLYIYFLLFPAFSVARSLASY